MLPNYLSRSRHNVYYFRFPLGADIHPDNKQTHIRISLRTSNEREALYTSHRLSYDAVRVLQHLKHQNMNYEDIKNTIKDRLTQFVQEEKGLRLKEGSYGGEKLASLNNPSRFYNDYDIEKSQENDIAWQNAVRNTNALFPDIELEQDDVRPFLKEFMRQYPSACQELLKFDKNPEDINFSVAKAAQSDTIEIELGSAITKFIQEHLDSGRWKHGTYVSKKGHLNLLAEVFDIQKPVNTLTKQDALKIRQAVQDLKVNRKKGNNNEKDKISTSTANSYFTTFAMFGEWLQRLEYIGSNVFKDLQIKQSKSAKSRSRRDRFRVAEVNQILRAVESPSIKDKRKKYQYWGVLLAVFTGARVREIAQLYIDDIKEVNDVCCIHINENRDDQSLKNISSDRTIPIHSYILERGFKEYLEELKIHGQDRLFPELTFDKKHGYGRNFSRWFNEKLLTSLELKREGLVLHSLRHSLVTELSEGGVTDTIIKRISGHIFDNDVMNTAYNKAEKINEMKDAIEKLPYLKLYSHV